MLKKLLLGLLILVLPAIAIGADFKGGENLKLDEKTRNSYIFASNIDVTSDQEGDAVVAGGKIKINNNIEKSFFGLGGEIDFSGSVGDNFRLVASRLRHTGQVNEDMMLLFAEGELYNSDVARDLVIAASSARINANVGGNTRIYAEAVKLSGKYSGNVNIKAKSLEVLDDTLIEGKLVFVGPKPADISSKAIINGGSEFIEKKEGSVGFGKFTSFEGLFSLIKSMLALIVATLTLTLIFKSYSNNIVNSIDKSIAMSALSGVIATAIIPIISVVLIISSIGNIIGLAVVASYVLFLILAYCYCAIYIGRLFIKLINRLDESTGYWSCVLGSILTVLIINVPYIGFFVIFIFFIIALGGIIRRFIYLARGGEGRKA